MKKRSLIRVAAIAATATGLCLSSVPQAEAGIDWGQILFGGGSSSGGSSAIADAISGKQKHAVKQINSNHKLLFMGLQRGDAEIVMAALKTGVDINGVYPKEANLIDYNAGLTPLGYAVWRKNYEMMQLLLENGADVSGFYSYDNNRISYLVWAASSGDCELVKFLHSWGASVNSEADINRPYGMGINGGKLNAVSATIFWDGIKFDEAGITVLEYLIENGANIESKISDNESYTPFLYAVKRGLYKCVDTLAAGGANLSAKTSRGRDAMQIAVDMHNLDMYKYLQEVFARGQQPSKYIPDNPKK